MVDFSPEGGRRDIKKKRAPVGGKTADLECGGEGGNPKKEGGTWNVQGLLLLLQKNFFGRWGGGSDEKKKSGREV